MSEITILSVESDSYDIKNMAKRRSDCKGKIYKGKEEYFVSPRNGEYVYRVKMVPLIRLSCNGCQYCNWIDEELLESVGNGVAPIIDNVKNGGKYILSVVNTSTDWESGLVDDFDLEFVRIPDEPK